MIDIDQIKISSMGVYLKWKNIEGSTSSYCSSFDSFFQQKIDFLDEDATEKLKTIVSFLSDGDFNSKKEALDVALSNHQASVAAALARAAYDDRSYINNPPRFNIFMTNAKEIANMMENQALVKIIDSFFATEKESSSFAPSIAPTTLPGIKENILAQQKLKLDNDGDGKIDNSAEAIMRRLGAC